MCPPGLAFASVSERALDFAADAPRAAATTSTGRKTAKSQRKGASPFTPAVTLFRGLDVALEHDRGRRGSRTSSRATTCSPAPRAPACAPSGSTSTATPTSARRSSPRSSCPATSTAARSRARCASSASPPTAARTQLKGRILRIAHCGYFGAFDILTSLSGLEIALAQLGHEVEHGAGVGAAQRVFLEAGVLAAA